MGLVPEIFITWLWFGFALDFPGVHDVFVHAFGFDARAVLIVSYVASIVMRILGEKCPKENSWLFEENNWIFWSCALNIDNSYFLCGDSNCFQGEFENES
jgi:hypothetical protein